MRLGLYGPGICLKFFGRRIAILKPLKKFLCDVNMLKAFPAFSRKAVAIGHLSAPEWFRLYDLSRQTRPTVWSISPETFRSRIRNDTSPFCKSIQLLDSSETIIAACFLDSTLLHSPNGSRRVPYITQLNRDLKESYRGTGSLLLDAVLEGVGEVYLKPANRQLETMYKNLGFVRTDLSGVGNPYFPIYGKQAYPEHV